MSTAGYPIEKTQFGMMLDAASVILSYTRYGNIAHAITLGQIGNGISLAMIDEIAKEKYIELYGSNEIYYTNSVMARIHLAIASGDYEEAERLYSEEYDLEDKRIDHMRENLYRTLYENGMYEDLYNLQQEHGYWDPFGECSVRRAVGGYYVPWDTRTDGWF